jgi:hypothetical protein
MLLPRDLLVLLCAVGLGSCTVTTPTSEFSLAQMQHYEQEKLYFAGNTPQSLRSAKRIAAVSGISCKETLFGDPPSLDGALEQLRGQAGAKSASAAVDIVCRETSPLVSYEAAPFVPRSCWPGFVCTGVAVK